MMRRLLVLVLGLLSTFVIPTSAAPIGGTGEGIVLRGGHSAYVDLTVYVATTIDTSQLVLRTKGSYVGFFMSPAPANRDTVGALVMPRAGATGADSASTVKLGKSWDVQAGRYRVFLLTNGASEVFIPITGQGVHAYTPRGRAPVSVRRADFNVAAGSAGASRRVPVSLRARSLVVVAGLVSSSSLTAVDELNACVSETAACATSFVATTRVPAARAWTYGADLVPAGSYAGVLSVQRVGGTDAGSHMAADVLVLTIGIQT
jgi:hypothetical protein